MQVNNLGGVRGPVTTGTNSTSQTSRTSFSTLMQGAASAPAGRASIPGASVISTAVSVTGGSIPGARLGAPYQQAMPTAPSAPAKSGTVAATPAQGTAGSEFNADLKSTLDQQNALKELMKMSLASFASSTFSMGQNRPKLEAVEDS